MKLMYFSIKYRYSDILLKKHKIHLKTVFFAAITFKSCNCVGMVSATPASHYVSSLSRYQSRSSMYIRGLTPRNWPRQFRL